MIGGIGDRMRRGLALVLAYVAVTLGGDQTWTNNSVSPTRAATLVVNNGVSRAAAALLFRQPVDVISRTGALREATGEEGQQDRRDHIDRRKGRDSDEGQ